MKNFIAAFCLLLAAQANVFAQEIRGVVSDKDGLPLPGVNVTVTGMPQTTATDLEGRFMIAVAPGTELNFTMVGLKSRTAIATLAPMVVQMEDEANTLEDVVVIGYGSRKAGSITGSVSQIKAADLVRTPTQSAIQAIQGKAAGVNIVTNDEPGATPTIRIRGLGTLLGGRDPLYVIDGIESNGLNGLSPNEIATIDILKDASSLAIYGQKGTNGVVIITTKKGRSGKIQVAYDTYFGQKYIQRKVKMADSYRFAYYNNVAAGSASYFNQEQPYNTDWLDEITTTGEVTSHYISLAGGNENANYYFGATNYREKGILRGTDFDRTNVNSRNEFRLFDGVIKVNQNINLAVTNNNPKPLSAFTNAYKQSPIVPVMFPNGRWGVPLRNPDTGLIDINGSDRFNNVGNPAAQLFYTHQRNKEVLISGSVGVEANITKALKFNSTFGATYATYKGYNFNPASDVWLSQNATSEIEDYEATFGDNEILYNTLNQWRDTNYSWNWDNFATYTKDFGSHGLTVVAGMSRTTKNINDYMSATRNNVPPESNYWSLDLSSYNTPTAPGSNIGGRRDTPIVSIAYFARAEYDYDEKYLFTAIIRKEGISSFQEVKKWGTFPAVSAGWVISKESFMENSSLFNFLKIRGGYGEIGNANSFNSLNQISFASGYNYAFGSDQFIFPGASVPFRVDPNLTWETMKEIDLGLDLRILDNRLSGTFDVYKRTSSDIILPIQIPDVLSDGAVTVNTGEVINKGVEASLRWENKVNDRWNYWLGGNFSYNENEISEVANAYFSDYIGGSLGNGAFTKQVVVGEALGSFYVYEVTGIDSDGRFTYSDERVAAGSYIPTYTYGFSFGTTYRNFDFSVDTYGVGGNKIYNGKKAQRFGGENIEYDYLDDFWTPSTPNATNPIPFNDVPLPSTYYLEDGAFFRINNITLGYTLPEVSKTIQKLRIYVTAINPFIFTEYSGYSPEVSGNGDPLGGAGIELDAYPTNKTFLIGVNASF
ncbi:MAG TPA: SusC/RagA family TonB-linked outer membrane protein [Flavobacterium sp.]